MSPQTPTQVAALISDTSDTDLNAWHDDGNGNLSYWTPEAQEKKEKREGP